VLLLVGEDASLAEYAEGWDVEKRPKGYEAAKTAICSGLRKYIQYEKERSKLYQKTFIAQYDDPNSPDMVAENDDYLSELLTNSIKGRLVGVPNFDCEDGRVVGFIEGTVDVRESMVNVDSLKQWLRLKGFTSGFFFPEPAGIMEFLNPTHPRYAPKLAAAVKAWQAVTDGGKGSPKQALDKWLREHAAEFRLTSDDGNPIEQAIQDCSKIANWKQTGGAPKTPSR